MKKRAQARIQRVVTRSGAVMIFALIALLVTSIMIGSLLKIAAMSHRQLKRDEYRLQASFLADAASERALVRLQTDPRFLGDKWLVPAEQLAPGRTATVRTSVTPDPLNPNRQIIEVMAEYPVGHPDFVRITRHLHSH